VAGNIDANGAPAVGQPLNIGGTNTTSMVNLGTPLPLVPVPNQAVSFNVRARMNTNAIIMNNAINITDVAAVGLVHNAIGHGRGPSLDFVVAGAVVGWADSAGINVQPPV
jgi:hypothetical protein